MNTRRFNREELFAELQSWNQRYAVGTAVRSDVYPGAVHKTRTEAVALFDQKPVIYLEGFNGYFDLHEIHPEEDLRAAQSEDEPPPVAAETGHPDKVDGDAEREPSSDVTPVPVTDTAPGVTNETDVAPTAAETGHPGKVDAAAEREPSPDVAQVPVTDTAPGVTNETDVAPVAAETGHPGKVDAAAEREPSPDVAPVPVTDTAPGVTSETDVAPTDAARAERKRIVVVFPGQGAQFKGMGKDVFDTYRAQTDEASEILGYSIEELCLENPRDQLKQTQYTQPALYVVGALNFLKAQESGAVPATIDALAGHSVGEYNALHAAGVFDFATGLRLVVERGRLMSQASDGGMAAVVGVPADELRALLDEACLQSIDLANFNSPSQIVISGPAVDVESALQVLREHKAMAVPLSVSAAFHSRYMQDAQREFATFLSGFEFNTPRIPVIANATAHPYEADAIADTLARQIASPVRWNDTIAALLKQGDTDFIEVGSKLLTRMIGEIRTAAAH